MPLLPNRKRRYALIDLEAIEHLAPRRLKAMLRLLRFVDPAGEGCPSLNALAMPGMSRSSMGRELADAAEEGDIEREPMRDGGYRYRVAERIWRRQPPRRRPENRPSRWNGGVPERGTHKESSSGFYKKPSEGEREGAPALSAEKIPDEWKEAAAAERRLAGLPDVDIQLEWRKLVNRADGSLISRWRAIDWVLKARSTASAKAAESSHASAPAGAPPPITASETDRQHARTWASSGWWMRGGTWGPPPDQPGCQLPPALIAWAVAERGKHRAARA